MNDRNSERERRVREMLKRNDKGRNPNEIGILSQGQAEIQGIQDELANELRIQQVQDSARLQTTGVMAQAAEGMLAMNQGNGPVLSQQVGNMNAGTQAIMQKYGVKPENSRKTQTQNIHTSSGGGTMNVRNEYTTNNHTDIRITQPQIPISQPQIPTVQKDPRVDNTAKFKTWLNGMFAKQQNEAEIQKKEYRKKEWNLARNTTRLMKRIEDASKNMTARLDPQRMTSSLGGQLKWLLLLFGATMISKVWTPAMKLIANIEGGIRAAFGLPINAELRGNATKGLSVVDNIKAFIGIKPGEKTSLIEGLGKVIEQGVKKLIDKIDFWFQDRSIALKEIKFPEIKTPKINIPGMDTLLSGITDSLSGIGQYLGDLITVAIGGSKGRVQAAANSIRRQSISTFTNTQGKKTSMGDDELAKGRGRSYMRESDFGAGGILKGNASSTQAMSRTITSLMNDKSSVAHTSEIASGVQQIFDVAKRQGKVVIDPEMLSTMGLSMVDINQLKQQKDLVQVPYKIIYVKPSKQDLKDADRYTSFNKTGAGWSGAIAGAGALGYGGAALGSALGPVGTAVGAIGGGLAGFIGGGIFGYGIGDAVDDKINQAKMSKGLIARLVPANSSERSFDGSPGTPKMMFALTKKGADHVAARFMANPDATSDDMNLTSREFYEKIRRIEERHKRRNGVQGGLRQNISNNALREAQARYDAYNKEWDRKFNADPNDPTNPYKNYDSAVRNTVNGISGMMNYVGETAKNFSYSISGGGRGRLTTSELKNRINYCMKFFMDHGLTKEQAAGVVGNLYSEGLALRNLDQIRYDRDGPSAGIAQFHDVGGSRGELTRLREFARNRGLYWGDLDTQLLYLLEGSQDSVSTINKIKQLSGDSSSVINQSSFLWGKHYERFGGSTRNSKGGLIGFTNYNDPEHRKRRGISQGIYDEFDPSKTSIKNYKYKPVTIDLKSVNETSEVLNSKLSDIAWLGDDQSCIGSGILPKGVSNGLGKPISYYSITGASPIHYLSGELKGNPTTNIDSLKNKNPLEALKHILSLKPKYCIIALGHNGVQGLNGLISSLSSFEIKTFIVKMWPIKKSNPESMYKLYEGVKSFGVVDLTWLNIEASGDGVHATSLGLQKAAKEIVHQLTTGEYSSLKESDKETVSDIVDFGSEIINKVGTLLSPEKDRNPLMDQKLTPEQKAIFEKTFNQIKAEREFNKQSWEEMFGANTNGQGTYIDYQDSITGTTTRAYLRTDSGHNALTGLKSEDISWVEVYGKDGKAIHNLSEDEYNEYKNSILLYKNVLFTNYPVEGGKGAGYNDYMTDSSGGMLFIHLGGFTDIDGFKKYAKKDFKGKIWYTICPNKDCTDIAAIGLPNRVKSTVPVSLKHPNNEDFGIKDGVYYGPIIFRKGETWKVWATFPEDNVYTEGWQPVCYDQNVKLTPEATEEARNLLKFLAKNRGLKKTSKGFQRGDGTLLSKKDIEYASDHHLIFNESLSQEGYDFGTSSRDIKRIDSEDNSFEYINKKFGDREKYYNSHKDEFVQIKDSIYHVSGIEFGSVNDKGGIDFYDDEKFKKSIKSMDSNLEKIKLDRETKFLDKTGLFSVDSSANLFQKMINYNRGAKLKNEQRYIGMTGVVYLSNEKGSKVPIKYKVSFGSDGTKIYTSVPTKLSDGGAIEGQTSNSIEGLISKIIENSNGSLRERGGRDVDFIGGDSSTKDQAKKLKQKEEILHNILNKGLSIDGITDQGYLKLSDGSIISNEGVDFSERDIKQFNFANEKRQSQVKEQEFLKLYSDSDLGKLHSSFIENINKTPEKIEDDGSGFAKNKFGQRYGKVVYGKEDENGNRPIEKVIPFSSGDEAKRAILSQLNENPYIRDAFYRESFGLQDMGYGSTRGDYKRVKTKNGDYYVKINTDTDLNSLLSDKNWQSASGGIFKMVGGKLEDAKLTQLSGDFKEIDNHMSKMVENQGLTTKAISILTDENVQAAEEAAEQRIKQAEEEINQRLAIEKQEIYLKSIAESLLKENDDEEGLQKLNGDIHNKNEEAADQLANVKKETNNTKKTSNLQKSVESPALKKAEPLPGNTWWPSSSKEKGVQSREKGGFTSYSENNDEVAGVVHANEWVANARTTSKFRPLFEFLDKYQKVDLRENPIEIKGDHNASSNASPSYVNTGGNVINSGNTTIYNYGNGDGSAAGFNRNNSMSGSSANQLGYNSSVSGKNRFNGGH